MVRRVKIKNSSGLARVAKEVLAMKPGVVALEGPLGTGKTTLTKELAKLMEIKDDIISPTFVLHRSYLGNTGVTLNHVDCWRMSEFGELEQIGLKKMIGERSLVVIEWAEKFEAQINRLKAQAKIVWVKMEYGNKLSERKIRVTCL